MNEKGVLMCKSKTVARLQWDSGDISYLYHRGSITLPAKVSIDVPGLSYGTIVHGCDLTFIGVGYRLFLYRIPGTFTIMNFLVDQGPVTEAGELVTYVFNLSNRRVKVQKGQAVSMLASL